MYLLVSSDVEEQVRKLWSGILRTVWCREAENQHHRLPREVLLRLPQESDRVIGYQVRVVVLKT
jgi:hypothetical protein